MEKNLITVEEDELYTLSSRMYCLITTMEFVACAMPDSESANMTFNFADSLTHIMNSLDSLIDGGYGF